MDIKSQYYNGWPWLSALADIYKDTEWSLTLDSMIVLLVFAPNGC